MLSLVTFTVARLFSLLSILFRFGLIKKMKISNSIKINTFKSFVFVFIVCKFVEII